MGHDLMTRTEPGKSEHLVLRAPRRLCAQCGAAIDPYERARRVGKQRATAHGKNTRGPHAEGVDATRGPHAERDFKAERGILRFEKKNFAYGGLLRNTFAPAARFFLRSVFLCGVGGRPRESPLTLEKSPHIFGRARSPLTAPTRAQGGA